MSYLFNGCQPLEEINISSFNTINVTKMKYMFSGCSLLKKIDLSHFKFNYVDISYMFSGCSLLNEVVLPNFNDSDINKMNNLFSGCSNELKANIRKNYKIIRDEAFFDKKK